MKFITDPSLHIHPLSSVRCQLWITWISGCERASSIIPSVNRKPSDTCSVDGDGDGHWSVLIERQRLMNFGHCFKAGFYMLPHQSPAEY